MHKSKLIQALTKLTPSEFRELGKFLESPFLNSNKQLVTLYMYLSKKHPAFEEGKISKEAAFRAVYPTEKAFNDAEMRALMADFLKAVKKFLSYLEFKHSPWQQRKMYLSAVGKRNDYVQFEAEAEEMLRHLEAGKQRDMHYFYEYFDLNLQIYFHPLTKKQKANVPYLPQCMKGLDHFFALAKLYLAAEMRSREKFLPDSYEIELLREVEAFAEVHSEASHALQMSLAILKLLREDHQDEEFFQLCDAFIAHAETMRKEEQTLILPFLLNYSSRQTNLGKSNYSLKNFELYKSALENGLLVENGKMYHVMFFNMVNKGLKFESHEWSNQFVQDNQDYLDERIKTECVAIANAQILFHKGKFHAASEEIKQIRFQLPELLLTSKRMLIQCLFEEFQQDQSFEAVLLGTIGTFKKWLYRNKNLTKVKELNERNFCRIIELIVKAHLSKNKKDIQRINEMLQQEVSISKRNWLQEKASFLV